MKQRNINVEYDGEFPNTCSGTLKITIDSEVVYEKQYCCGSTGSVWFDSDWGKHIESGHLVWKDADKFDWDIRKAVEQKLFEYYVCCGGCV